MKFCRDYIATIRLYVDRELFRATKNQERLRTPRMPVLAGTTAQNPRHNRTAQM
jgi:hypothetical protein